MLASGPVAARTAVQPVLDAIGARTLWLGDEPGPASAMKLVANAWVAAITAAAAQSVALADAFGLDPAQFLAAVSGGAADSPYLQAKGGAMVAGSFDPQFALDGVVKDVGLIRDAATAAGVPTTLADAVLAAFRRASDAGHGREDMAAVIAAFRPPAAAPAV